MTITTSRISQETVIDKLASLTFQANTRTQSGIEHVYDNYAIHVC